MNRLPFAHKGGSIFAAMFGAVAMMGVVGVAAMNMIGGPITTASKVTHQNMAQNDLLMNAKIVVMNASTRPNQGDEDGDGYVEPVPFIPTSAPSCNITLPTGSSGGCLPSDIGAILTDPWGTQYMYCVWDHGDPASSTNRINGEDSTSGAVLAIISAGPNKRFETPCRAYDGDPATNDDAVNPDGIGDDLIQIYTYAAAVAGSGGLWELKQNEPETAIINKKLEIGDMATGMGFAFDTATGQGEFPYVKTDFIASKTGGSTPVTMVNNIALDGNWLSGDGGNEGVFIDNQGRVGIGASDPDVFLDIARKDLIVTRMRGNHGHYYMNVQDGTGRINHYWNTRGSTTPNFENAGESALNFKMHPYRDYGFQFNYADGTSASAGDPIVWKNLMTINVDGTIGVGTTSPKAMLDVFSSDSNSNIGQSISATRQNTWSVIANTTFSENHSSHFIGYRSRGTIDSPQYPLRGDSLVQFEGRSVMAGPATGPSMSIIATENHNDNSMGGAIAFRTTPNGTKNSVTRMQISEDGNVGIGTSNPSSKLHIVDGHLTLDNSINASAGSGGNTHINMMTHDTDGTRGLSVGSPNKGWGFFARGNNYTGQTNQQNDFGLAFYDSGVWRNRIFVEHDTGNVGIGTPEPTEKLQVNGLIDVTNNRILRVATPTDTTDAANKAYVDSLGGRTCSNGQILKYQSGAWACAGDNSGGGGSDNLGNHTATQDLKMGGHNITNSSGITINTSNTESTAVYAAQFFKSGSESFNTAVRVIVSGSGTSAKGIDVTCNGSGSSCYAIEGISSGTASGISTGIRGRSSGGSSSTGIVGYSSGGTTSTGVTGYSTNSTGVTTAYGVQGYTTATIANSIGGYFRNAHTAGYGLYCQSGNASGCGGNRAWTNASDGRLKDHVVELSVDQGLAAIMRLRPVTYQWRTDDSGHVELGFIAQEVENVLPELVGSSPDTVITLDDGYEQNITDVKSLSYSGFVVPLVKAVQELKAENEALRSELQTANDNFRRELDELKAAVGKSSIVEH